MRRKREDSRRREMESEIYELRQKVSSWESQHDHERKERAKRQEIEERIKIEEAARQKWYGYGKGRNDTERY